MELLPSHQLPDKGRVTQTCSSVHWGGCGASPRRLRHYPEKRKGTRIYLHCSFKCVMVEERHQLCYKEQM